VARAGRNMLLAVTGFGIAMIVFGLSTSFALSLAALVVSGICDGVSVVIRRTIMRMLSPDHLRGRIASVNSVFIGSSNEIGALESGVAASLIGARPTVWLGGIVTLAVVAAVVWRAPKFRRLRL
jgi:MFS family permease